MSSGEKFFPVPLGSQEELVPVKRVKKSRNRKKRPVEEETVVETIAEVGEVAKPPVSDDDEVVGYASEQYRYIIKRLNEFAKVPAHIENETRLVLIQFYLLKLEMVDTSNQTCHMDFGISMWWKSPEIVGKYGDEWDYNSEVKFWPELEFSGEMKSQALLENHGSVWINECFSKHGIMNNYQRWKAVLHVPMQLQEFPFDQQIIRFRIASWAWGKDSMVIENVTSDDARASMTKQLHHLVEWKPIENLSIREHEFWDYSDERWMSAVTIYIPLRRVVGFYLNNIISMGALIAFIGVAVLFEDPVNISNRLELAFTLFLAAVAFNFVIAEYLPKVSYSNYMTEFFMTIYVLMGIEVVETVAANLIVRFKGDGDTKKAPFALTLDWITIGVLLGLQLLYLLRIMYLAKWRSRPPPNYDNLPYRGCCSCCYSKPADSTPDKVLPDKK